MSIFDELGRDIVLPDDEPQCDWASCPECGWEGPWEKADKQQEGGWEEGYWTAFVCPECGAFLEPTFSPEGLEAWEAWRRKQQCDPRDGA